MEEESVDFLEDPLEGQHIWSSLVINPFRYASTPTRIIHLGRNPLKEETLEIIDEMVKSHFDGRKSDDVIWSDNLIVQKKKDLMEVNVRIGFQRRGTP